MSNFKVNDRVVLTDVSNSTGIYKEGQVATVMEVWNGRLTVLFDEDHSPITGKESRFRLLTPLDELL